MTKLGEKYLNLAEYDYDLAVKIVNEVDAAVEAYRSDLISIGGRGLDAHIQFGGDLTFEFRLDDRKTPKMTGDREFFHVVNCAARAKLIATEARKAFKVAVLMPEKELENT